MEKISSGTMNRLSVGTSGREGSGGGGPSDEWGPMVGCRCMRAGVERGGGGGRGGEKEEAGGEILKIE